MTEWEHEVQSAKGKWTRGPVRASFRQEVLVEGQDGGWEL
jgi:hypothetical protein